jgi:hypothetical protein
LEEERRIQWSKEKTMIYKTLFRKQKNKQHEIHKIAGVNSGTPEGLAIVHFPGLIQVKTINNCEKDTQIFCSVDRTRVQEQIAKR